MPTGQRRDGESILSVHADAAHGLEQPLADRALGVVVERADTALGGVGALPGLPDGGRAGLRHGEPAGDLLVLQQPVGRLRIDLLQHAQDQRRGEKARAQPPAVVLQRFQQALFGVCRLFLVQQSEGQRPDQLGLPVGIQIVLTA